jgi:hypothetical protein
MRVLVIAGLWLLAACSPPYYATVVEAEVSGPQLMARKAQQSGFATLTMGSATDASSDDIAGALLINRTARGDEDAMAELLKKRASELGFDRVIGVKYTKYKEEYVNEARTFAFIVGLLQGSPSEGSSSQRKPYIVCYEPPLTGETDKDTRDDEAELFGNTIRRNLAENGYYPAPAHSVGQEGSEKLERLQAACPPIAGYYLGASFSAIGGLQYVIGLSRHAGAELRLTDLGTGQLVWRKDGHGEARYGYGFNLASEAFLIRGPRLIAIDEAFKSLPPYKRKDGPAEM